MRVLYEDRESFIEKHPSEPAATFNLAQNWGYHDRGLVRVEIPHVALILLSSVLP